MPLTKINPKLIIDLNVKHKTIKFLEDNIGENLDDLGYGDTILDIISKTRPMKERINKLDLSKLKTSAL